MKTSQIKTFLSVVRNGSVAAAARELNRSRTTVSTVLASLEDELGVELFERSGNQLHLTAIGQSILTDCRRFDQVASQIRARCQHHLSGAESVLRIARDDAIPEDIWRDILRRLKQRFPQTSLSVYLASPRELAPLVRNQSVAADMAMIFGAVNVVGCLAVWGYLRWSSLRNGSGLVQAEQRQWLMDSALSAAVMIGFGAAWLLERSHWAELAVYADPVMMLVISVYFMTVPVKMVLESVRELLLAAPKDDALDDIHETLEDLGLNPEQVRVAKLGPNLLLEARMIRI